MVTVPPVPCRRATWEGRLLPGTIAAMTTADVRAHEESLIRELHGRGLSIRAMAKRTGFSRPKVDRIVARIGADNGHRSPIAYLEQSVPEPDDEDMGLVSALDDSHGGA